jgi:hypothetical protein
MISTNATMTPPTKEQKEKTNKKFTGGSILIGQKQKLEQYSPWIVHGGGAERCHKLCTVQANFVMQLI